MGCSGGGRFRLFRRQTGISLIETVIALALLGLIGAGFLGGLTTASKGTMISQERVTAESLAKSQLEHIKTQSYITIADYDPSDPANRYQEIDISENLVSRGYDIEITSPETIIEGGVDGPFELQSITVVVKVNDRAILTVSSYRCGSSAG